MKSKTAKNILTLAVLVFLSAFAQAQTISGIITDASGPLPGANVVEKGTSNGVQADFDGNYTLTVEQGETIIVSFLGYKSQELVVSGNTMNIVLEQDASQLAEVVVLGYGSTTKKDATGAVDALGSDSFDQISAPSPAQLLRGKVAGVQVISSSGEPGAGLSLRVRGNSSIRSGNNPLIVVDGVPLAGGNISSGTEDSGLGKSSARNPLNFINQNDIASISVLKDASSTAIYGSRGANGVIIITTKRGTSGKSEPQVTYNTSVVLSSLVSKLDVASTQEYIDAGGTNKGGSYDWKKTILQSGFTQNHDLSISNSSEKSSTRLSLGASLQDGIIKKTGLDKYTVSFSNTSKVLDDRLKIDTKVLYSGIKDRAALTTNSVGFIGNLIGSALYWNPTISTRGVDNADTHGGYTFISNNYLNPQHLLEGYDDVTKTNKILANVSATVNIIDGLSYKILLGIENSSSRRATQLSPLLDIRKVAQISVGTDANGDPITKRGFATVNSENRLNKTIEHTLNYTKSFNDLTLNALLGYSYYQYSSDGSYHRNSGFSEEQTNLIDNLEGSTNSVAVAYDKSSFSNQSELQSFFGRVTGTYQKFLATLTVRTDGSSKTGKNNKYGTFPSLGLGYKIFENESDMIINNLKVRLNAGQTGNQEFPINSAVSRAEYNNLSQKVSTNENPDLRWETTTSYGVGVDFELLDRKLSGSIDYFHKDTKDLIFPLQKSTTQPGPDSPRFVNLDGNLINSGVEVGLNYDIVSTTDLNWSISANTSFLSNKITNFPARIQAGALHGQGLSGANAQIIQDGKPIYSYNLFEFVRYNDQGNSLYLNDKGEAVGLALASKRTLDKQALPKLNIGFSTTVSYKNFDLGTSFYGAFGHYIYNNTQNAYFFKSAFPVRNTTSATIASPQNTSDPNSPSTKYLEKGDFLRWSNLTIGYTFESELLSKIKLSSARVYVSANNLMVFTAYSGFDPEVSTDKTLNGVPSASIDYLSYPRNRSFAMGLNVKF